MDSDEISCSSESGSDSESDSEESLYEEEIEDGGSREMILMPKKKVSTWLQWFTNKMSTFLL